MAFRMTLILWMITIFSGGLVQAAEADHHQIKQYRDWVDDFKDAHRGPFKSVQWFCNDGTVLPPKEYACKEHGGGRQHGEWNDRAMTMRENGYLIANVLSAIEPEQFITADNAASDLSQILLEQFLKQVDDGWVLRKARFYRGAIQVEAEQDSARKIVLAMLADKDWLKPEKFLLLREAVRLLPITLEPLLGVEVRKAATDINEQDAGFHKLRVKIHSLPDDGDAAKVREYAEKSGIAELKDQYEALAAGLDKLFGEHTSNELLWQLHDKSHNKAFRQEMVGTIRDLYASKDSDRVVAFAASKAQGYRKLLSKDNPYTVYNRLRFLRATLVLEQEVFVHGNLLLREAETASRRTRLGWLRYLAAALHATGMLSDRQWQAISMELNTLLRSKRISVSDYHASLNYLTRVSQWSQRALEFHFSSAVKQWLPLTPLVQNFVPDRLRGSPLLPYTRLLDTLIIDANRLSGIKHQLFGREVGSGLRALNPGLRRGILLAEPEQGQPLHPDGIYILNATTQNLTPVAGIITRGEGSSVSHVQLLARNMGIPNLVADEIRLKQIRRHIGKRVILAVSQKGVIHIMPDEEKWDMVFGSETVDAVTIEPDLDKLNLNDLTLIPLQVIRSSDSGRTVGPKAANLGQLAYYYPDMVTAGLVIPFGVFRKYLDQPIEPGGSSIFVWMQAEYRRLEKISSEIERNHQTKVFLEKLRNRIIYGDPGAAFTHQLRSALTEQFGSSETTGLFVRSDTNVEDLPGFNGAGLNLTVPNVIGFDEILHAVKRVWASPFSERAFAWRQSYMTAPEHVYPAVLLMQSFASEKSGVMVTADVGSGNHGWLSIAVNEGVGGAVEGQAAEELRVDRKQGDVQLMSQATAPKKMMLSQAGGIKVEAAVGMEQLLSRNEIVRLQDVASDVDARFPLPRGSGNKPVAADIEFGFNAGKLALFQIRPFVESRRAWNSPTLQAMDSKLSARSTHTVNLDQLPIFARRNND
ncbi:phosphoenolpyruvate synthase [Mariprofundus micogutta]|uniref:Phosphoenolpyruvate synthase n=1 Tax=Mariprofundus micogutta TaxID=1921010 RepID=A0A1L8CJZ7_9PROT|nr:PEP/pyruvate-binding domain-containing protein [Mariprofundus micogutta]GAV19189.1 phosphoenolpyruvate synthase [Mariprofundus micogutta]